MRFKPHLDQREFLRKKSIFARIARRRIHMTVRPHARPRFAWPSPRSDRGEWPHRCGREIRENLFRWSIGRDDSPAIAFRLMPQDVLPRKKRARTTDSKSSVVPSHSRSIRAPANMITYDHAWAVVQLHIVSVPSGAAADRKLRRLNADRAKFFTRRN